MNRIWIDNDWFIPVDDRGYVEGPCFEGMLGCVMQLGRGSADAQLAMKIPRLLADTIEENAYICILTEEEMNAVRTINTASNVDGLVPAQLMGSNPLVKRRTTTLSHYAGARDQADHVIFVSFERDKKPRFCAVNWNGDGFHIVPQSCREDFEANVSPEDWEHFVALSKGEAHLAFSDFLFRSREARTTTQSGLLRQALKGRQTSTWYAALPSIVFQWASGNLQETITKREIGTWPLKEHFVLFEQVLRGVRFLHSQGMIHGDVRPANIMCIGATEAGNYRLGDYGSYGKEWQMMTKPDAPGGRTDTGPAIGQRRQTPFYSPERRAGNEYESADTAVITTVKLDQQKGTYDYVLLLGWRSALLKNGVVKQEAIDTMKAWGSEAVQRQDHSPNSDELQRGDRLRIRNYLFEVIRSKQIANNQRLYLCSPRYAEILHDTLAVYKASGSIKDWTVLDLSNYVEFHQWAAASDLFSVGAVCLYSLFCSRLQNHWANNENGESYENPDRLFLEMVEILESVPYFRFFWEELEGFRQKVEELYQQDPQPSPAEAKRFLVLENQSLFDKALYATNNILQSTPKAKVLLEAFNFNLAHFLLFMHFVLACLHRRSHMSDEILNRAASEPDFMSPFAEDRLEPPQPDGAAARALQRLLTIGRYLDQPFFRDFRCEDDGQILDFDPRSDFQIRIEDARRRNEILRLPSLRAWPLLARHPAIVKLVQMAAKAE